MNVLGAAWSCAGGVIALAMIVVGAVWVRQAKPSSGYLLIAAGALSLLTRCCVGFTTTDTFYELDLQSDVSAMVYGYSRIAAVMTHLTIGILVAISLAGLAKVAKSKRTTGG